jgi:hypothetical protein
MIKNILKSFFGTKADKDIKEITPVLNDILKAYETIKNLSNDELRGKTISFRKNIAEYIAEEENKIQKIKQQLEKRLPHRSLSNSKQGFHFKYPLFRKSKCCTDKLSDRRRQCKWYPAYQGAQLRQP